MTTVVCYLVILALMYPVADAGTKFRWGETTSKTNQARLLDKNSSMIIA
jgi:hypothetical protein